MSKFLSFSLVFVMLVLSPLSILADQIVLKNGDKLTGKIIKKDGDSIIIETEFAGIVTIKWDAVEKIIADEPVNIKLSDGQLIKGTVATAETVKEEDKPKFKVETQNAGTVEVEKENVEVVRNDAEEAKVLAEIERFRNPALLDLWEGSADVGFSLTAGNSKTRTLTAGIRGSRETEKDKMSAYLNAIQASNSTGGPSVTTAQAVYGGVRYDYNLSEKTFAFASGDFEYDKPQLLDLRSVIGAGIGYKAIRSERTKLDLFGGATYNRESFSTGITRNSAEALIGDDLTFKLNNSVLLEQRFKAYPSITNAGEFRALFDASVITTLNEWLGWQVTLGDRYNSDPVPGAVSNDIFFTTGLRATFGRKK